jgi:hypothetical protein
MLLLVYGIIYSIVMGSINQMGSIAKNQSLDRFEHDM